MKAPPCVAVPSSPRAPVCSWVDAWEPTGLQPCPGPAGHSSPFQPPGQHKTPLEMDGHGVSLTIWRFHEVSEVTGVTLNHPYFFVLSLIFELQDHGFHRDPLPRLCHLELETSPSASPWIPGIAQSSMEETVVLTPRKEKTAVSVPEAPPVLAELVASAQQTDKIYIHKRCNGFLVFAQGLFFAFRFDFASRSHMSKSSLRRKSHDIFGPRCLNSADGSTRSRLALRKKHLGISLIIYIYMYRLYQLYPNLYQ